VLINILFSISLGLLIAGILLAVGYARLVREPERLRWVSEANMYAENAAYFKRLTLKTLSRWQMLQGYSPLEDELETVDRTVEEPEDEPTSLLRLPDDELAERIREMNDPRSGMNLSERRRIAREDRRRKRIIAPVPVDDESSGIVNELNMSQTSHLRG